MNRQELRDRILQGLNESTSSPVFFSLADINGFIDEAIEMLAEEVSDIRRTVYVPRREGAIYYTIGSIAPDIMAPFRVTLHEEDTRLTYTLMTELDNQRQRWMEDTADTPDWWFPVSWDMFGVWPGSASSDGFLRVDYLAWPEALASDSDEPEFSIETHDAIVSYGIAEGLLRQWDVLRALDYWGGFTAMWRDRKGKAEMSRLGRHLIYRARVDDGDLPGEMI